MSIFLDIDIKSIGWEATAAIVHALKYVQFQKGKTSSLFITSRKVIRMRTYRYVRIRIPAGLQVSRSAGINVNLHVKKRRRLVNFVKKKRKRLNIMTLVICTSKKVLYVQLKK